MTGGLLIEENNGGRRHNMKKAHFLGVVLATGLATIPAHATLLGLTSISPGGSVVPGNATDLTTTNSSYTPAAGCPTFTPTPKVTAPPTTLTIAAGSTVVADTCDETVIVSHNSVQLGTGTLREVVARESGGTLDFYYQAFFTQTSSAGAGWGINRVFGVPFTANSSELVGNYSAASLLGSGGASTKAVDNVNVSAGAGFGGAQTCANSSTGISSGKDCITFDFSPSMLTGVVVISTPDTSFSALTKGDMGIDASNGSSVAAVDAFYGYVPLAPSSVPEPVSIVLLGSVLAFSAFFIRRRRTSAKNESSVS